MAHKAQPLGFQIDLRTPDDQLCQPFRTVDEEKVAAVFQRPGGRPEQVGATLALVAVILALAATGRRRPARPTTATA